MNNRLIFILQLALILGLYSCSAYKPVVSTSGSWLSAEDYINTYKDLAVSEMKRTGIPASITLAQGMIESDYGRSPLAREANNYFGIKCHDDWTGAVIRHNDDRRNECFRKYNKPEESFYDHSDFLKSGSRYSFLFDIDHTDYKGWARGLKKAGYATNSDYANMLIKNIEENNLWQFDREYKPATMPAQVKIIGTDTVAAGESYVAGKPVAVLNDNNAVSARVPRVMEINRIQYIIIKDGDTREKLEREFGLLRWELSKYNDLKDDFTLSPGQILYLQPKREKAEPGKEYHNTLDSDTMYLISQRYGIKLKSLYEMNRMDEGAEPEAGKIICLRKIKPVN
ncbi:MAG: glucosaminidase domain-containing protein [Bacteroidota bacterium]